MKSDELFTDVEYVNHKYKKINKDYGKSGQLMNQDTYQLETETKDKLDPEDVLNTRLHFLKKNVLAELKIGAVFVIFVLTFLMLFWEIFKNAIIKQIIFIFFIVVMIMFIVYFFVVQYRINKIKKM